MIQHGSTKRPGGFALDKGRKLGSDKTTTFQTDRFGRFVSILFDIIHVSFVPTPLTVKQQDRSKHMFVTSLPEWVGQNSDQGLDLPLKWQIKNQNVTRVRGRKNNARKKHHPRKRGNQRRFPRFGSLPRSIAASDPLRPDRSSLQGVPEDLGEVRHAGALQLGVDVVEAAGAVDLLPHLSQGGDREAFSHRMDPWYRTYIM